MKESWKNLPLEVEERKVLEALADSKWDYRTMEGLVKSTGLSEQDIRKILEKQASLVRKSRVPDRKGRDLFTLREKGKSIGEILNTLKTFISKSQS